MLQFFYIVDHAQKVFAALRDEPVGRERVNHFDQFVPASATAFSELL